MKNRYFSFLSLQGEKSEWAPFLITLPDSVPSPVFWAAGQQEELLRGSPVLKEAKARATALQKEWSAIQEKVSADPGKFDPGAACFTRVTNSCMVGTLLGSLSISVTDPSHQSPMCFKPMCCHAARRCLEQ